MGEVGTHSKALGVSQGSSRAHPGVGVQGRNWQALSVNTHPGVMSNSLNLELNSSHLSPTVNKIWPSGSTWTKQPSIAFITSPAALIYMSSWALFTLDVSKFSVLKI